MKLTKILWTSFLFCLGIFAVCIIGLTIFLNTNFARQKILHYLNNEILASTNTQISYSTVAFGAFPMGISLYNVDIVAHSPAREGTALTTSHVELDTIVLSLNLLESWNRRFPVINHLGLNGVRLALRYDAQGNLITPFIDSNDNTPSQPLNPEKLTKIAGDLLPNSIELENIHLLIGADIERARREISLSKLTLHKRGDKAAELAFDLNAQLPKINLMFPHRSFTRPLQLSDIVFSTRIIVREQFSLDFIATKLLSNSLQFSGNGQLNLFRKDLPLYLADVSVDLEAKEILDPFDLAATGQVHVEAKITPDKDELPTAVGKVTWQNIVLEKMNVYSGKGDIKFTGQSIFLENGLIKTPKNATIGAAGEFAILRDKMPFRLDASLQNITFEELMIGLDADNPPVHFLANSEHLTVVGTMDHNLPQKFTLAINGPVTVSNMIVPSMHNHTRTPVPSCRGQLALYADATRISFDETTISCNPDHSDRIVVESGSIEFDTMRTDFILDGSNIDLGNAAYFLAAPASGPMRMKGTLTADKQHPVRFEAEVAGKNILLYGIHYDEISGLLKISEQGVFADSVEALAGGEQKIHAALKHFGIRFQEKPSDPELMSEWEGTIDGDLAGLRRAISQYIPDEFPGIQGQIAKGSQITLRGPLLEPKKWSTLEVSMKVDSLLYEKLTFANATAAIHCHLGVCTNSRLALEGVQTETSTSEEHTTGSLLLLDVRKLSIDEADVKGSVQRLPLALFSTKKVDISSSLDAQFYLHGPWKHWEGGIDAIIDQSKIDLLSNQENNKTPHTILLGPISISGSSTGDRDLVITANGHYKQLSATLRIPHDLKGDSSLYFFTRGFDFVPLLNTEAQQNNNLISNLQLDALFEGPGPLSERIKGEKSILDLWKFHEGNLFDFHLYAKQKEFALQKPCRAFFTSNLIKSDSCAIIEVETQKENNTDKLSFFRMEEGRFEPSTGDWSARGKAAISMGTLQKFSDLIKDSTGSIFVDEFVTEGGSDKKFTLHGSGHIDSESIGLRGSSPVFRNVQGSFTFTESALNINKVGEKGGLRALKGLGEVNLFGSIDWTNLLNGSGAGPHLDLFASANEAQFKVAIPSFGTVDLSLSSGSDVSGLHLWGEKPPYTLRGNVAVTRARIANTLSCTDIISILAKKSDTLGTVDPVEPLFSFDLSVSADRSIWIQTNCIRARLSTSQLHIGGNEQRVSLLNPSVADAVLLQNGNVYHQKMKADIERGEIFFESDKSISPRLSILLTSSVPPYRISVDIEGTASDPRVTLGADPSTLPNGQPLTEMEISQMLLTGAPIQRTTSGQAQESMFVVNEVAHFFYNNTDINQSLSDAASKYSLGAIDSVELIPVLEEGGGRLKGRISKSIGEKWKLFVESDPTKANSLGGSVFLNDRIFFDTKLDSQTTTTSGTDGLVFSGGFGFQYGSD